MPINKEWHQKNRMPTNASLDQRINWHLGHAKNCDCRPMPEKLAQQIREKTQAKKSKKI